MNGDQLFVFGVLIASLVLFAWERWRYDVVALAAMFALVAAGTISAADALQGFGHPAVITVAAVLVISRALRNSGIVDLLSRFMVPLTRTPVMHIAALTGLVAFCSAFMNNVGALALLLPVAIATGAEHKRSPGLLLMPLAFGSILGGLITMIGTPPNIIIATFRQEFAGESFAMFDFLPVGLAVTVAGVAFVAAYGWRLIPDANKSAANTEQLFEVAEYIIEVRVAQSSDLIGLPLTQIRELSEGDAVPIGVVRGRGHFRAVTKHPEIRAGDVLVLEADAVVIKNLMDEHGLELAASGAKALEHVGADRLTLCEAVVTAGSALIGRDPRYLQRRVGGGLELVALARQGRSYRRRLRDQRFRTGDVLLLQGDAEVISGVHGDLGLLPLAERELQLHQPRRVIVPLAIFAAAIAASATGLVHIAFAFTGAILLYVLLDVLPLRELYKEIDWPVIVLLGAMLSLGQALQESGGTTLIADTFVAWTGWAPAAVVMLLLMVITIALTNVINNAAAALLMAPIAAGIAQRLEVSIDPFLMAVAVAASCAFLTPVGHQSNTLVMGPGGYRFSDYWRMGLPLTGLILVVSLPMLLIVWPF